MDSSPSDLQKSINNEIAFYQNLDMNQINIMKSFVRTGFRLKIRWYIDGSSKSFKNIFQY